ncbi:hypothetical protein SAMN05421682_10471 [Chryseobacterium indoltheticum]|uniref:Uncharacterized protein n=1 Tax=Chryseobacterium indoltheticum TaxID=254 RepID=A0A381F4B5_9FLAO|nr:hypothetical protein EG358_14445 [Chryseobacterium indoltheticum]SIQ31459.1 hypothetical protein SAMN05421682_10471 [Chryseobacterium indoltheticum]SUX41337.1 Uncharacterised protein [Chryseobacterium indoltheticum]
MDLVKRYIYKTLQVYETLHRLSLICEIKYEFLLKKLFNNKMELLFFLKISCFIFIIDNEKFRLHIKKEVKNDFPILFIDY